MQKLEPSCKFHQAQSDSEQPPARVQEHITMLTYCKNGHIDPVSPIQQDKSTEMSVVWHQVLNCKPFIVKQSLLAAPHRRWLKGHFIGTNPNLNISQGLGPKMHITAENVSRLT